MTNEDIYTKIARLRTRRTMSHFATASDYKIHGEGYREAISDMAELAHQEARLAALSVASAAPELPEPLDEVRGKFRGEFDYVEAGDRYYTQAQIVAHARAAVLAEREAIARQIEDDVGIGALGAAIQIAIAAAIRARN